ncbi:class I SAM-dependent methyltransferase [Edaphobacter sp.]|uniref:class I SAM-dependent methyltransferase n=1 Tax=Edaphobacter sp. TaxID=1934404 RepID=UPI002DBE06B6|nr:methyltransferase domain-containing protein [Edaphobacter sp.]HEU5341058.1 methyltransferase domain-containing protein [Edaphobacter sp.]
MINRTKEVFDRTASTYDRDRSLLIPGCDTFYRWAIDLIPAGAKTILDLGAGSGLLTRLIRNRFPDAHIHLIDFSAPMLALAGDRMGNDPRVTYQRADYVAAPVADDYCAVVSSLSIHHLDDKDKRAVYKKMHGALKPNGVFINAEQVAGPTAELDARYKALWLRQVREAGATEQQVEDSLFRQQEDRCSPVAEQLRWMREAGFEDADCWYKDNRFAVMAGTRA